MQVVFFKKNPIHREQAQGVHLINNRICYDQQQNILLKCAYFVVTINNRMLTRPTAECYKNRHSVVGRVSILQLHKNVELEFHDFYAYVHVCIALFRLFISYTLSELK